MIIHPKTARQRAVLLCPAALFVLTASAQAQQTTVLPGLIVETSLKLSDRTDTRLKVNTAPAADGQKSTASDVSDGASGTASGADGDVGLVGGGGIAGSSTTVITRQQIERAPQATLAEIIGQEAGVQLSTLYGRPNGAGTTVDLRGFGATGSSNTLVLINGRRLNDWDSAGFDFSTIPVGSIDHIEITRGNAGAVLYGDGAVGGVINIVTRSAAGSPNQVRVEGGIGSYGSREASLSANATLGGFSSSINSTAQHSDGYRDNNAMTQENAVGDFRWAFAKGSVYFNIAGENQTLGLPGVRHVVPGGVNEVISDPRGTSTPFDFANKQEARATFGFTYLFNPGLEAIVDGGFRKKEQQAGFFTPFVEQYVATELTTLSLTPRLNITLPFFGLRSRAIAGTDIYDTDYSSDRSMFKGLAPVHVYSGSQQTYAAYWQQSVTVLPGTEISAGARVQRNQTTASDRFDASAPGGAFDVQGVALDRTETNHAWNVGLEQKLLPSVIVFGRLAQSFRVPNMDERIGMGFPTNFDLRTQQSRDWETGAKLRFGNFALQSSYFDMQLTDEIYYDAVNFVNKNLEPTRRRGVETLANWQVLKTFRLFGNVTYTDATFRDGPNAGNEVPVVSRWTGNVGVSWNILGKALSWDTVLHYVGERRMDNDAANFQPQIPAHTTVDMRLGGEFDRYFWSASAQNVFDSKYFDYAIASTTTLDKYNAYTQPGRTFMVKAGMTW